ncbi:MAG: ATP-binding protein, partial [Bacteroidota bacterium]
DKLHLFFPFYRGKKNIGIIEGSGLGLNIVKRCVESLKGVIKLTEEPGKGCVFTVKLPYN